ncbi:hypothetical protein HDE_13138 [Halotydeus destructor]|nr:hypothetical protein HDE_13138 [Halotydeus destructor]
MSSELVKFLDYDNQLLADYVAKFHKDGGQENYPLDNMTKKKFQVNETAVSASMVEDEIKQSMAQVYQELTSIPFAGEMRHPTVLAINQAWCQYVTKSLPSWYDFYASAVIIHLYRRITTPEYQTPGHMRLVYAACTAFEWITNTCLTRDDIMDDETECQGRPAWHLDHAKSVSNDILIVTDMARLVMKHIIPREHPFHGALCDELDHFIRRSTYCYTYASFLAKANADKKGSGTKVPIDGADMDTLRSFCFFRSEQMVTSLFHTARLLACYQSIPLQPCHECTLTLSAMLCTTDDLRDMTPEGACDDIANGEIHNIFLPLALQMKDQLPEAEAVKVMDTLLHFYGTKNHDDAIKVREMYWSHGIPEKAIDLLKDMLDRYENTVKARAVQECNIPDDMFDFSLSYVLRNEKGRQLRDQIHALSGQGTEIKLAAKIVELLEHKVKESRKKEAEAQ